MIDLADSSFRRGLFALLAQLLLALGGGLWLASDLLPAGSAWLLAGPVGAFAALVLGFGAATGFALLLAPLFVARGAVRYAQSGDVKHALASGRGERAFGAVAALIAMVVIVCTCLATAAVLWLAGDAAAIDAFTRFAVLGGFLAVLAPRALQAFG